MKIWRDSVVCVMTLACLAAGCSSPDDFFIDDSLSIESLKGGGTQFGANIDDVMWYWNVTWDDVKDTPDWIPGEAPAISMPQALAIAQSEIVNYADAPDAYELDGIDLLPITHCCDRDHPRKWIYLVDFERRDRFASGARGTIRIPVLLDGRAIAGTTQGTFGKVR